MPFWTGKEFFLWGEAPSGLLIITNTLPVRRRPVSTSDSDQSLSIRGCRYPEGLTSIARGRRMQSRNAHDLLSVAQPLISAHAIFRNNFQLGECVYIYMYMKIHNHRKPDFEVEMKGLTDVKHSPNWFRLGACFGLRLLAEALKYCTASMQANGWNHRSRRWRCYCTGISLSLLSHQIT